MRKIAVDIDGTLAEFRKGVGPDVYCKQGYSKTLKPYINLINALKYLVNAGLFEVYSVGAVMPFSYIVDDKNEWLDCHVPEILMDNRYFIPYGASKAELLKKLGFGKGDLFIDDFNLNLEDVEAGTEGDVLPIKFVNEINDGSLEWSGIRIHYCTNPEDLALMLYGLSIAKGEKNVA